MYDRHCPFSPTSSDCINLREFSLKIRWILLRLLIIRRHDHVLIGRTTMSVIHIRTGNLAKIHPQGNWWTKEGFDVRAAIVCYHLSKLLLYKHELLLSKCPLIVDWLLIRPVWNEISNEPLNYDPFPECTISDTPIPLLFSSTVYVCLLFHICSHLNTPFQSVTAAEGQTSACLTPSSTGARAVGGAVWAAATTPTGPTVSAAEKTTTGALLRSPAIPATAILMVLYPHKPAYCLEITCKAFYNPCK